MISAPKAEMKGVMPPALRTGLKTRNSRTTPASARTIADTASAGQ